VARSLRSGSTGNLGVVLGEHLTYAFDDPGAVSFLAGVAEVCAAAGYGMTILPISGAPEDAARVADAAVDGFIVWTTSDDDPVLTSVLATRRPAVVHGGPALDGAALVSIDNRSAARAVGAVVFAGARRPAVVSQPLTRDRVTSTSRGVPIEAASYPVTRHRLAGLREAAEAAGTDWSDVLVAVCSRNDADEAERVATALLASDDPPDAIAAMSDEQAVGVLRAARAAGLRIPQQLAVSGWDDLPAAAEFGLTTVAQSLREQGASCARVALGEAPVSMAEEWSLVVRGSTRG
jgi:DNA-binding LacI/PurR family transcriptional regulator